MTGLQAYIERGTVWGSVGRTTTTPPPPTTRQVGALPIGTTNYAIPSGSKFIDPASGNDTTGTGSIGSPWATVAKAIAYISGTGTIVMRAGSYHETLSVPAGKSITFQAYPGEAAWFDGSIVLTSPSVSGSTWVYSGWTFAPTVTTSSAYVDPAFPAAGNPTVATIDGTLLTRVTGTPGPGQFAVDAGGAHTLTIGSDPTGREVRASNLKTCITGTGQVTMLGVGIRRYATDVIQGANGPLYLTTQPCLMENCISTQNGFAGISLFKGAHVLRYCTVSDNGYAGITGDTLDGTSVTDCLVTGNNRQHFKSNPSNGAMKFTRADGITIARNTVTGNLWINGIWLDVSVRGFKIYSNTVTAGGQDGKSHGVNGHDQYGILAELSGQGFIADNYVRDYQYNIVARCSDHVDIYNNDVAGANSYTIALVTDSRSGNNSSTGGTSEYLHGDYPAGVPWIAVVCTQANNVVSGTAPAFFQIGGDDEYVTDGWQTGTAMQLVINGNWLQTGSVGWPNTSGGQTGCSTNATLNTAAGASWTNAFGATAPADSIAVVLPDAIADAVGVPRGTQKVGKLT